MKDMPISKLWWKSQGYSLVGTYERSIKYFGQIDIIVTITQEMKIKISLISEQFPTVSREYDADTLEQAESIINEYCKKVAELRNKLSGTVRKMAEKAYREVLDNGYANLLKGEKIDL